MSTPYETAWRALEAAAIRHASAKPSSGPLSTAQALAEAAKEFTAEWRKQQPAQSTSDDVFTAPFGRDKGKALTDIDTRGLNWLRDAVASGVDDPAKSRWKAQNQALLDAIEAELEQR